MLGDLEVRTAGAPEALVPTLRQVLAEAEPKLPVYDILPIEQRVARSLSQDAVIAQLTSVFSGISLLLACLGLYGTISYGVNQRVAELGLRIALGADRRQVLWLVMREALVLVAIGSVVGFSLAYLAARSLGTVLYGIGPVDPLAYGTGAALLLERRPRRRISSRVPRLAHRADARACRRLSLAAPARYRLCADTAPLRSPSAVHWYSRCTSL